MTNCDERKHTCRWSHWFLVDPPVSLDAAKTAYISSERDYFFLGRIEVSGSISRHNWSRTASERASERLRKSDVVLCASFTLICGLHPARRLAEKAVGVDYLSLRGANRSRITSIHDVRCVFTFALRNELMPDGFFGSCGNMYTLKKKNDDDYTKLCKRIT